MKQVSRVEESIFLSPNKGFKLASTISIANSFEIVYIAFFTDFLKINSQLFFYPYWLLLLFFLLKCELDFLYEFRGMKWIWWNLEGVISFCLIMFIFILIIDDTRKSPTPDSSMMGRPDQ